MNTKPRWLDIYKNIKMRFGHELVEEEKITLNRRVHILQGAVAELQEHVKWLEGELSKYQRLPEYKTFVGADGVMHAERVPPEDADGVIANVGLDKSANEYE